MAAKNGDEGRAPASLGGKQVKQDKKSGRFLPGNKSGGRKKLPEDLKMAFRAACPDALRA